MSTRTRKIEQHKYSFCRDLPIWDVVGMENEGVLNWRFRPAYIDARIKRAVHHLSMEAC